VLVNGNIYSPQKAQSLQLTSARAMIGRGAICTWLFPIRQSWQGEPIFTDRPGCAIIFEHCIDMVRPRARSRACPEK
jgi:tRNA-dihydrouridine synthase